MTQIVFVSCVFPQFALLEQLVKRGYLVTVAESIDGIHRIGHMRSMVLIVIIADTSSALFLRTIQNTLDMSVPWLVWNRTSDSSLTLLAYASGASAVLPDNVTELILHTTITSIMKPDPQVHRFGGLQHRHYQGTYIRLEAQAVLEVKKGILVQKMVYGDGVETLLGLYGPGQVLVGHPDDECGVQLQAHTDVVVTVRDWQEVSGQIDIANRLCERIRTMEAWASIQARPYLDERILGLLGLLAEQFGVNHSLGTMVNVRLTHGLLASALGVTRSTITRALGNLRCRGRLEIVGKGNYERFCVKNSVGNHRTVY